ncbi:uncharacterized protein LOC143618415 [Bidens hawaiensis]|uniref:uncharacterized protein LOC143618415 n=1 Tax=Bidens hawaiensis TaxID=980011 RepID=UPI00404B928E
MEGKWFTNEVLLIPLENYDMILGVQWLSPLEYILWNFQKMTMKFKRDGVACELKGIENNKFLVCSGEKMGSILHKKAKSNSSQLFSIQLTKPQVPFDSKIVPGKDDCIWQPLFIEFRDVFQAPTILPPERKFDHKIVLKEGTTPISQRSYRYPMVQKNVIDKTIRELLEAGIIRGRQSDLTAPVVLVKKKYGQWRMCMDY